MTTIEEAAAEQLAGRTVWSVGALASGRGLARRLDSSLGQSGEVRIRGLELPPGEDEDPLEGGPVAPDDLVVLHDPLAAQLAPAVRDHGAHALWHLTLADVERALGVPGPYTTSIDAYLVSWRGAAGAIVVATFVPCAGATGTGDAWPAALAGVVEADRHDCVGGTFHARPAVAAR